jgi:hypothetical protein
MVPKCGRIGTLTALRIGSFLVIVRWSTCTPGSSMISCTTP